MPTKLIVVLQCRHHSWFSQNCLSAVGFSNREPRKARRWYLLIVFIVLTSLWFYHSRLLSFPSLFYAIALLEKPGHLSCIVSHILHLADCFIVVSYNLFSIPHVFLGAGKICVLKTSSWLLCGALNEGRREEVRGCVGYPGMRAAPRWPRWYMALGAAWTEGNGPIQRTLRRQDPQDLLTTWKRACFSMLYEESGPDHETNQKGCFLLEKHLHVYWRSPHNYHLWQVLRAYKVVVLLLVLNFIAVALKHKQK